MKLGILKIDVIIYHAFFVVSLVFSVFFLSSYWPLHIIRKAIRKLRNNNSRELIPSISIQPQIKPAPVVQSVAI